MLIESVQTIPETEKNEALEGETAEVAGAVSHKDRNRQ